MGKMVNSLKELAATVKGSGTAADITGNVASEVIDQIADNYPGKAANVPAITDASSATAADVAGSVNAALAALKAAGLMEEDS